MNSDKANGSPASPYPHLPKEAVPPPVERRTHHYWRDCRIVDGCISERRDLRATEQRVQPALLILQGLEDIGVEIRDVFAALDVIERGLDDHGEVRTGELVKVLLSRMGESKRGCELKAALIGCFEDGSGQAAADKFKITRQTMHKNVARLRRKLLDTKNV